MSSVTSLVIILLGLAQIGKIFTQAQGYFAVVYLNECQGPANYTLISSGSFSSDCSKSSTTRKLIQITPDNKRLIISLQPLAVSQLSAGAWNQLEVLFLAQGGPLDGKFIYEKVIYLTGAYLKKCSSVLGYSYVTSKSSTLLISEKLELDVFISPLGAFETFKQSATITCKGVTYIM